MPMMNEGQARVVDPILTTQSRGFKNAEAVAGELFPDAPVSQMGGKRIEFGKESFVKRNTVRAPGADTKEIIYGYEGKPFALTQHRVAAKVPKEHVRAGEVPGISMQRGAVQLVQDVIALEAEVEAAELALDPSRYAAENKIALAGTSKWTHEDSDPAAQIDVGKEAVRSKTGKYPNVLVIPPKAFVALKRHKDIRAHFSAPGKPAKTVTLAQLAEYFELDRVVVGKMTYVDGDGVFKDVWSDHAVLAYVSRVDGDGDWQVPSYGYKYRLRGNPTVEQGYWDKDTQSWKYPVEDNYANELVGAEAGYLLQNVY